MRDIEDVKPTLDLPLSEAMNELTGFEIIAIEKHFGAPMENVAGTSLLIGAVWAFENRGAGTRSWADVKSMSMRQLNGYFEAEPVAPDDESELGKD